MISLLSHLLGEALERIEKGWVAAIECCMPGTSVRLQAEVGGRQESPASVRKRDLYHGNRATP